MEFEEWKEEVDGLCWDHFDCSTDDLPDMPYYDLYEQGMSPDQVALYMVHELDSTIA